MSVPAALVLLALGAEADGGLVLTRTDLGLLVVRPHDGGAVIGSATLTKEEIGRGIHHRQRDVRTCYEAGSPERRQRACSDDRRFRPCTTG